MFENDVTGDCTKQLEASVTALNQFQDGFDQIRDNFKDIDELHAKTCLMKQMVKRVMKKYEKDVLVRKAQTKTTTMSSSAGAIDTFETMRDSVENQPDSKMTQ